MSERNERLVGLSRRIYGALLTAYPKEFRLEYGADMVQLFKDQCRDELRSGGVLAWIALWFRTLVELVSTTRRERDRSRIRKVSDKREPVFAVVCNLMIWPGIGQMHNLQMVKGTVLAIVYVFWFLVMLHFPNVFIFPIAFAVTPWPLVMLWSVVVVIWLWSVWDAYRSQRGPTSVS